MLGITMNDFRIPQSAFVSVSEEIEQIFPHENKHIYFVPYRPKTKNSPRTLSSGKLWAKYINSKRTLLKCLGKFPIQVYYKDIIRIDLFIKQIIRSKLNLQVLQQNQQKMMKIWWSILTLKIIFYF